MGGFLHELGKELIRFEVRIYGSKLVSSDLSKVFKVYCWKLAGFFVQSLSQEVSSL